MTLTVVHERTVGSITHKWQITVCDVERHELSEVAEMLTTTLSGCFSEVKHEN
jgi:hypothetical protein